MSNSVLVRNLKSMTKVPLFVTLNGLECLKGVWLYLLSGKYSGMKYMLCWLNLSMFVKISILYLCLIRTTQYCRVCMYGFDTVMRADDCCIRGGATVNTNM